MEVKISMASKLLNGIADVARLNDGGNAMQVSEFRRIDATISSGGGMSL